jgi:diguanylate cyclase (GGDEF)-like protein
VADLEAKALGGIGVALAILVVVSVVSFVSTVQFNATADAVSRTLEVSQHIGQLMRLVFQAQAAERGFTFSGSESDLKSFYDARTEIARAQADLRGLTDDDPALRQSLSEIGPLLERRVALSEQVIELRRLKGVEAAAQEAQLESTRQLTASVLARIEQMEAAQNALLAERGARHRRQALVTRTVIALGNVLALLIVGGATWLMRRGMAGRRDAEKQMHSVHENLLRSVAELERRNVEITRLSELGDLLECCQSQAEAWEVLGREMPKFFPHTRGALFGITASRNLVEAQATWGADLAGQRVFAPEDCWGLRRVRLHVFEPGHGAQPCPHAAAEKEFPYLCAPMAGQGEPIGFLHVQFPACAEGGEVAVASPVTRLAGAVAEQVALALANLRLRETLRQQSIRDPLTGLFNRRYLEETLEREIRRASRASRPLALFMIDLDHFKRYNDTFGHEAGDTMLREVGTFLRSMIRADDVACRYGGEEFALVLPDTTRETALTRAEKIRAAARHLNVQHQGAVLGSITLSLGMAMYPRNAETPEELLRAADMALYDAKAAGRDRVVVCPDAHAGEPQPAS